MLVDMSSRLSVTSHSASRMKAADNSQYLLNTTNLNKKQVNRLRTVLSETVEVHGKGNFPTISARLIDIVSCVRRKLRLMGMPPQCVKLNGGAASFVASPEQFAYADLDLIFPMTVTGDREDSFEKVRQAVFDTLTEMIPGNANKSLINAETLKDVYIRKMVKVSGVDDCWSLFTLHNDYGRCIELKFVDRMRRQFEFSVDSFQITLDPLIDNFEHTNSQIKIESVFGDINTAMSHLNERLIDTRHPEQIRGGGLLKYCYLLVRGYKAARPSKCRQLEKYMCSRFFIDFPNVNNQEHKLRNYIENHFGTSSDQWSNSGDDTDSEASTSQAPSSLMASSQIKYDFLMMLHRVISESTVCLMTQDRKMTLAMIDRLAVQVSLNIHNPQPVWGGHMPKTTLFYLPPSANQWIPVV